MVEIKELVVKANEQCKRIRKYIEENEGMFDSMNLKLHDASFYEYSDMKNDFPLCYAENERWTSDSYFCRFCDSTYSQFTEWCKEEGIDFNKMCHRIGRTSRFYLYEKDLIQWEHGRINWALTMYEIYGQLGYSNMLEFDKEGNVDEKESLKYNEDYYTKKEWKVELKPELTYIIDEMYDDFIKEIEDVKKVYTYIRDTKDNQVAYFKEYLKWNEADLQDEKDKENVEKAKRNEIIEKMPERIHGIMKRSALDNEDLNVVLGCMVLHDERTISLTNSINI